MALSYSSCYPSLNFKQSIREDELQLKIETFNHNAVEAELINQCYGQQRNAKLRQLFVLSLCYTAYRLLAPLLSSINEHSVWSKTMQYDVVFLIFVINLMRSTMKLIKSEKLLFCMDFALQLQTIRFFSRKTNVFIPSTHIYDVCINEVIENLEVHYILIVRTKSKLFIDKPIIPLFNKLKPPLDCLEIVYKLLNKMLKNKQSFNQ